MVTIALTIDLWGLLYLNEKENGIPEDKKFFKLKDEENYEHLFNVLQIIADIFQLILAIRLLNEDLCVDWCICFLIAVISSLASLVSFFYTWYEMTNIFMTILARNFELGFIGAQGILNVVQIFIVFCCRRDEAEDEDDEEVEKANLIHNECYNGECDDGEYCNDEQYFSESP